jgi:hypothetical protein
LIWIFVNHLWTYDWFNKNSSSLISSRRATSPDARRLDRVGLGLRGTFSLAKIFLMISIAAYSTIVPRNGCFKLRRAKNSGDKNALESDE